MPSLQHRSSGPSSEVQNEKQCWCRLGLNIFPSCSDFDQVMVHNEQRRAEPVGNRPPPISSHWLEYLTPISLSAVTSEVHFVLKPRLFRLRRFLMCFFSSVLTLTWPPSLYSDVKTRPSQVCVSLVNLSANTKALANVSFRHCTLCTVRHCIKAIEEIYLLRVREQHCYFYVNACPFGASQRFF